METCLCPLQECFCSIKPAFVPKFNRSGCCEVRRGCVPAAKRLLQASNASEVEGQRCDSTGPLKPSPKEKRDLASEKNASRRQFKHHSYKIHCHPLSVLAPSPGRALQGLKGPMLCLPTPAISQGFQLRPAMLPSGIT